MWHPFSVVVHKISKKYEVYLDKLVSPVTGCKVTAFVFTYAGGWFAAFGVPVAGPWLALNVEGLCD